MPSISILSESCTITPASPFRTRTPPNTLLPCEPWWMTMPASPVSLTSLFSRTFSLERRVEDDAADLVIADDVRAGGIDVDRHAVADEVVVLDSASLRAGEELEARLAVGVEAVVADQVPGASVVGVEELDAGQGVAVESHSLDDAVG